MLYYVLVSYFLHLNMTDMNNQLENKDVQAMLEPEMLVKQVDEFEATMRLNMKRTYSVTPGAN